MSDRQRKAAAKAAWINERTPERLGLAGQRAAREMVRQITYQTLPISNKTMRGLYVPVELAASVRPGAMDAFALPSVVMGKRVWPRRARQKESMT